VYVVVQTGQNGVHVVIECPQIWIAFYALIKENFSLALALNFEV
jgi:hypothetical protein